MEQPYTTWQSSDFRYGYNGVEEDNEIMGNGNSLFTDFRIFDTRLGRWWSRDPIVKQWESSYAGMANNPINIIDPSGLDGTDVKKMVESGALNDLSREERVFGAAFAAFAGESNDPIETQNSAPIETRNSAPTPIPDATLLERGGAFAWGLTETWIKNEFLYSGSRDRHFRDAGLQNAFNAGRATADVIGMIGGGIEILDGLAGEGAGLLLDGTGVGAFLGVPVGVVSGYAVLHGGSKVAITGLDLYHLSEDISNSAFGDPHLSGKSSAADQIANGHAWDKHKILNNEFPEVASKSEFSKLIDKVMKNPKSLNKKLKRGREAWYDESSNSPVIKDPSHIDGGTAFRPTGKRTYFDGLR